MKKLMMAVALACAASFVQASTCSWGSAVNYFNGDEESASDSSGTKLGKSAVTSYLFYFASADAYNAALSTIEGQDHETASWAKEYIANNTAAATGSTGKSGSFTLTDGVDYAKDTTLYGVVIAKTTQGGEDYYYASAASVVMGNSAKVVSDMNVTVGGSASSSTTAVLWNSVEAVPEPFSGALALLGMGAIALRRKMRKAKKA